MAASLCGEILCLIGAGGSVKMEAKLDAQTLFQRSRDFWPRLTDRGQVNDRNPVEPDNGSAPTLPVAPDLCRNYWHLAVKLGMATLLVTVRPKVWRPLLFIRRSPLGLWFLISLFPFGLFLLQECQIHAPSPTLALNNESNLPLRHPQPPIPPISLSSPPPRSLIFFHLPFMAVGI